MKYIIDVPEDRVVNGKLSLFAEVESPLSTRIQTGIKCEPYTEPDRKAIEDEVWEFAGRLYYSEEYGGMNNKDFRSAFYGESAESVALNMSYQEAKSRYDTWKKQNDDKAIKQKVIALADEIGIHKLYAIVRNIRGE